MNMKWLKKALFGGSEISVIGKAFSFECKKIKGRFLPMNVTDFRHHRLYISECDCWCKRLVTDLMSVAKATTDTNRRHLKTFDYESIIGELAYDYS